MWKYKEKSSKELYYFFKNNRDKYIIEVESPDGDWVEITDVYYTGVKQSVKIETENNCEINCALSHLIEIPHSSEDAYIVTKDLKVGCEVITNKGVSKVKSIKELGSVETYDISVSNNSMKYYAGGIVSHNSPGSGKTTTGRILANGIICDSKDNKNKPCHECESCKQFKKGAYPDYIEVDAGQYNKIEDVKKLIDIAKIFPINASKNRIILIDEAHRLSNAAWDSMLKLLEEGVTKTIFIFATTEGDKIRRAIHSRSLSFKVKPLSVNEILKELINICKKEQIEYDIKSLESISYQNNGRMRDAIKTLDMYYKSQGNAIGISVKTEEEKFCDIIKEAYFNNIDKAFQELDKMATSSQDLGSILCNSIASIYCYPNHIISGIPESVLQDMRDLLGSNIKTIITQFMEYKPQTYEQVKLFMMIISESGINIKNDIKTSQSKTTRKLFKSNKEDDTETDVEDDKNKDIEDF